MTRSTRMISVALAALPLIAFTAAIEAANTSADSAAQMQGDAKMQGDARHWHHHDMRGHGPVGGGALMGVLHELDLTSAQKEQVHGILSADRAQMKSEHQGEIADLPALGNPGDPQHAAAVQSAAKRAADRVQHWSSIEQQVYAVLTPAQQAQLPKLLADMQQRMAQHADQDGPPANPQ